MARDGIPAEFSSFAVTFTANGEVVKTITFAYGGSIDESQIPDCRRWRATTAPGRSMTTAT